MLTGISLELGCLDSESELRSLCSDLRIRNFETIVRNDIDSDAAPTVGYEEIHSLRTEFPTTTTRRFMNPPKEV
jgi:hypothetical protein